MTHETREGAARGATTTRPTKDAGYRYHIGARVRLLRSRAGRAQGLGTTSEEGVVVTRHKALCYEVRLQNSCLVTCFEWDLEPLDAGLAGG